MDSDGWHQCCQPHRRRHLPYPTKLVVVGGGGGGNKLIKQHSNGGALTFIKKTGTSSFFAEAFFTIIFG